VHLDQILDLAISRDVAFAASVSEKTWSEYRTLTGNYTDWLAGSQFASEQWSEPEAFAAFLNSLDLGRAALTKRCTAMGKLVAAARIVGIDVADPNSDALVKSLRAVATPRRVPDTSAIEPDNWYTLTQAAALLGVCTRTVRRRFDEEAFPSARQEQSPTGASWRIPGNELVRAFNSSRQAEPAPTTDIDLDQFEQLLESIGTTAAGDLRDRAALLMIALTADSEPSMTSLKVGTVVAVSGNPILADALGQWVRYLQAAGASQETTLWPSVNRGGTPKLTSKPVRLGTIVRRRMAGAGYSVKGIDDLRSNLGL